MAKIKVKVLKLSGETGLRLPGSVYFESEVVALNLEVRGLVEIILDKPKMKQSKAKVETKEEKFVAKAKTTKSRKAK